MARFKGSARIQCAVSRGSICPTLGLSRANLRPVCRFACDVRGAAACAVTATCGGCLVADLQPGRGRRSTAMAQDSLLFGPLPCRAKNTANRAALARKYMYRLPPVTHVANFQPSASHRGSSSRPHALSGSSSVRRVSMEHSVFPLAEKVGAAHHAAYLWRRVSGEYGLLSRNISISCPIIICYLLCGPFACALLGHIPRPICGHPWPQAHSSPAGISARARATATISSMYPAAAVLVQRGCISSRLMF